MKTITFTDTVPVSNTEVDHLVKSKTDQQQKKVETKKFVEMDTELCMYDGFKLRSSDPNLIDFLLSEGERSRFKFVRKIDVNSGDISSHKGKYKNLEINIFYAPEGWVVDISGSIHKFSNDGEHNFDDFYWSSFLSSMEEIIEVFHLKTTEVKVVNLEVGVNCVLPDHIKQSEEELLDLILSLKGRCKGTRRFKETKRETFFMKLGEKYYKIYGKGIQYKREERIIRFELGYMRQRQIAKEGSIVSIEDLVDISNHEKLKRCFLAGFETLHIFNPDIYNLSSEILSLDPHIIFFNEPGFWCRLKKKNRREYLRWRKYKENLEDNNCKYNLQKVLLKMVGKKLDS